MVTNNQLDSAPRYLTACGGEIHQPEKYPKALYHGEEVYFCTMACLRAFEQNPEGFMNGDVEHPMDAE